MSTQYGIKHQLTAVYSPQANESERVNRSINEALRSYIRDDQRQWDHYLGSVNSALGVVSINRLGKPHIRYYLGKI